MDTIFESNEKGMKKERQILNEKFASEPGKRISDEAGECIFYSFLYKVIVNLSLEMIVNN